MKMKRGMIFLLLLVSMNVFGQRSLAGKWTGSYGSPNNSQDRIYFFYDDGSGVCIYRYYSQRGSYLGTEYFTCRWDADRIVYSGGKIESYEFRGDTVRVQFSGRDAGDDYYGPDPGIILEKDTRYKSGEQPDVWRFSGGAGESYDFTVRFLGEIEGSGNGYGEYEGSYGFMWGEMTYKLQMIYTKAPRETSIKMRIHDESDGPTIGMVFDGSIYDVLGHFFPLGGLLYKRVGDMLLLCVNYPDAPYLIASRDLAE
jgi:hypothetical protein